MRTCWNVGGLFLSTFPPSVDNRSPLSSWELPILHSLCFWWAVHLASLLPATDSVNVPARGCQSSPGHSYGARDERSCSLLWQMEGPFLRMKLNSREFTEDRERKRECERDRVRDSEGNRDREETFKPLNLCVYEPTLLLLPSQMSQ